MGHANHTPKTRFCEMFQAGLPTLGASASINGTSVPPSSKSLTLGQAGAPSFATGVGSRGKFSGVNCGVFHQCMQSASPSARVHKSSMWWATMPRPQASAPRAAAVLRLIALTMVLPAAGRDNRQGDSNRPCGRRSGQQASRRGLTRVPTARAPRRLRHQMLDSPWLGFPADGRNAQAFPVDAESRGNLARHNGQTLPMPRRTSRDHGRQRSTSKRRQTVVEGTQPSSPSA